MSMSIKAVMNLALSATPVAAGASGAILGEMAGFELRHWLVLGAVIVLSIMAGATFVAGETTGAKFWSAVAVKMVMGFGAALATGGSLKVLVPVLLGISVLSPAMLRKNALKIGGFAGDDKPPDGG